MAKVMDLYPAVTSMVRLTAYNLFLSHEEIGGSEDQGRL